MSLWAWITGSAHDQAAVDEAKREIEQERIKGAEAKTRMFNALIESQTQARRVVSVTDQVIQASRWPWERRGDEEAPH